MNSDTDLAGGRSEELLFLLQVLPFGCQGLLLCVLLPPQVAGETHTHTVTHTPPHLCHRRDQNPTAAMMLTQEEGKMSTLKSSFRNHSDVNNLGIYTNLTNIRGYINGIRIFFKNLIN